MRKPLLLIAGLIVALAAPVLAQESERDASEQDRQTKQSSEQAKPGEPKPRSRPAQSFTPSEEIRADTSVAFPADI